MIVLKQLNLNWFSFFFDSRFLKIFRLTVLGDFDLSELEGLSDSIHARINGTKVSGDVDVDSKDWDDEFHRGVRYEFVVLSLVITVVVMNVYIGLLGELYTTAQKKCKRLFRNYRASCAYRHMCELFLFRCLRPDVHRGQVKEGLFWFTYSQSSLSDGVEAPWHDF